MKQEDYQFVQQDKLSEIQRVAAAGLVVESLPQYYEAILRVTANKQQAITGMLGIAGGETENTYAAVRADGTVTGIVSGVASRSLKRAQLIDMQTLFREFTREQRETLQLTLADISRQTQNVATVGWYLTRISIAPGDRGNGLADALMDIFFSQSPDAPEYSLHVHKDNARAISFYHRHGFSFLESENAPDDAIVYRAMHRNNIAGTTSNLKKEDDE